MIQKKNIKKKINQKIIKMSLKKVKVRVRVKIKRGKIKLFLKY